MSSKGLNKYQLWWLRPSFASPRLFVFLSWHHSWLSDIWYFSNWIGDPAPPLPLIDSLRLATPDSDLLSQLSSSCPCCPQCWVTLLHTCHAMNRLRGHLPYFHLFYPWSDPLWYSEQLFCEDAFPYFSSCFLPLLLVGPSVGFSAVVGIKKVARATLPWCIWLICTITFVGPCINLCFTQSMHLINLPERGSAYENANDRQHPITSIQSKQEQNVSMQ